MEQQAAAERGKNYTVKNVDTVIKGTDVLVRVFTLAPGDCIPWHFHSESDDHYFVLQGQIIIERRDPSICSVVDSGKYGRVTPGTHHSVSNKAMEDARFVLVQGVGKHDWLKA